MKENAAMVMKMLAGPPPGRLQRAPNVRLKTKPKTQTFKARFFRFAQRNPGKAGRHGLWIMTAMAPRRGAFFHGDREELQGPSYSVSDLSESAAGIDTDSLDANEVIELNETEALMVLQDWPEGQRCAKEIIERCNSREEKRMADNARVEVRGLRDFGGRFKQMMDVRNACREAEIDPPDEVKVYFGILWNSGEAEIRNHMKYADIDRAVTRYAEDGHGVISVDLSQLPKDVKHIEWRKDYGEKEAGEKTNQSNQS